ncbi:uncharacterized protein LOC112005598 [Quercus suber]|uniref:uncharacterized protein LOC112005598 n=1 Tax=Quercus suber TaxID=58331 RepID=UPI000CE28BD2|nr:uncharacterized protein LOC112005598 [Quercus suber]
MNQIDKYKRVEEDQQQDRGKDKGKVIPQERRDFRSNRYNNNRPRRDFAGQFSLVAPHVVNTMFRKPVHQVLEKIKNEPYFKWLKMSEDPLRRNRSLHYQYHQERRHTIGDYRTLWSHLEQLVKEGKLQHLLYRPNGQGDQSRFGTQRNASSRPPIGTINVIFVAPGKIGSWPSKVMFVTQLSAEDTSFRPKRARIEI